MIIFYLFISILILYFVLGFSITQIFLRRRRKRKRSGNSAAGFTAPKSFKTDRDWLEAIGNTDIFVSAYDGTALHARFIQNIASDRYVICCHGYRANSASVACFAKLFYGLGFSVIMPDARAHGKSGGKYIGMGWIDRLDLLSWIHYINRERPDARIALFGVSMGGTTVMNTIGEDLPANVLCGIEDSGFVSIRAEMFYQSAKRHLPKATLYTAVPFCKLLAGFSPLQDKNTKDALSHTEIPMLFIHGTSDDFVPLDHFHAAINTHHGHHSMLSVSNAGHADAILTDPDAYRNSVTTFINTFIP